MINGVVNASFLAIFFIQIRFLRAGGLEGEGLFFANCFLFAFLSTAVGTFKNEYREDVRAASPGSRVFLLYASSSIYALCVFLILLLLEAAFKLDVTYMGMLALALIGLNAPLYVIALSQKRFVLASSLRSLPVVSAAGAVLLFGGTAELITIVVQCLIFMGSVFAFALSSKRAGVATFRVRNIFVNSRAAGLEFVNFAALNSPFFLAQSFLTDAAAQDYFEYSRLIAAPWNLILYPLAQIVLSRNIGGASAELKEGWNVGLKNLLSYSLVYIFCMLGLFSVIASVDSEAAIGILDNYSYVMFGVAAVLTVPRATIGVYFPYIYRDSTLVRKVNYWLFFKLFASVFVFYWLSSFNYKSVFAALAGLEVVYVVVLFLIVSKAVERNV